MGKQSEMLRLEKHIQRLLDGYNALQAVNRRLESELRESREQVRHLEERLDTLSAERGDVYERVSSLIGRIERWEAEQEGSVAALEDEPMQESGSEPDAFDDEEHPGDDIAVEQADALFEDTDSETGEQHAEPPPPSGENENVHAVSEDRGGGVQRNLFAG